MKDTDVERLRSHLNDPKDVCEKLGLLDEHKRQAGGVIVLCPFHDENTPSCSVKAGKDGSIAVNCFGCGAKGDVFTLIAAVERIDVKADFQKVLEFAASMAGVRVGEKIPKGPRRPKMPEQEAGVSDAVFHTIVRLILGLCSIDCERDVVEYLRRRGLYDAAKRAGWGALPRERSLVSTVIRCIVDKVGLEAWQQSGLAGTGGEEFVWWDRRLMIPWRTADGRIQALQRRAIANVREGTPKYVFSRGRKPSVPYGVDRLTDAKELAIVEGAMDCEAYRTLAPHRDVIGIPGTAGWNSTWKSLACGRTGIVALDNDDAGNGAAVRIANDLHVGGALVVERSRPVGAKDWAEVIARRCAA